MKLIFTAVNNLSSNGLNERLNQTPVNRIRCKINDNNPRIWSEVAEECISEYNRTIHTVTKFSPDYLMYGRMSHKFPTESIQMRSLQEDRVKALANSIKNFEDRQKPSKYNFKENECVYVENGNKLNRGKTSRDKNWTTPCAQTNF